MLDFILLSIGLLGFGAASYYDLRYTEFQDWLPYSMILSALAVKGSYSILTGNYTILANSFIFGILFLGLGLILYFTRQWGDGDAWLLGALGFLFPDRQSMIFLNGYGSFVPFHLAIIFNLFIISLFYIIVYSLAIGTRNNKVRKEFLLFLKKNKIGIIRISSFVLAGTVLLSIYLIQLPYLLLPLYSIISLAYFFFFFINYAKSIENNAFKRRINVAKLKEGDVLAESKWKGLTKEELKKIKQTKKFVYIKEGIRFAPVFLLNILITSIYGGMLFL